MRLGVGRLGVGFLVLLGALGLGRAAAAAEAAADPSLPPGLAAALAQREYQASANARGLQAPNRAHGLRTYFGPDGIRVHERAAAHGPALLALGLAGVGRGARLEPVGAGLVVHDGARVEIRRPGLVEWFVNSEAGLEHGFTLAERPAGEGALRLELQVGLASAALRDERVLLTTRARHTLEYAKLAVYDAAGRRIAARFELPASDRLQIVVADALAAYPLTVDPLLTQSADTQLESDQAGVQLGFSAASAGDVNGDGYADLIVGAPFYDAGEGFGEGAAFVFLGSAAGIASVSAATAARLEANLAGAHMGSGVAGAGDVNGDGYDDVLVGAELYSAGESEGGAAFVFHGGSGGIDNGNPATAAAVLESDQADALFGHSVGGAGDVNGDGYADVIVGANSYDSLESNEGAAFVFHGGSDGIQSGGPTSANAQLEADQGTASFGASVAGAGDVNGDGYADVIVGAPSYDSGTSDEGAAFVFHGGAGGVGDGSPASADAEMESDLALADMGFSVASAGDVNGDFYADVIVGAPGYSSGQTAEGAAFVFLGSASGVGNGNPGNADSRLESDQGDALMGYSVASGDVNGDGYADALVGAQLYNASEVDEGALFVFLGGASGIPHSGPAGAFAQLESGQGSARLGSAAAAADVNGDGYADAVAGAPLYNAGHNDEGAAFVYLGGAQGIVDGSPSTAAAQLESDLLTAYLGWSVASAGDVNGDGYTDVIVGAPAYDAGQTGGAAFLFLGSSSGITSGGPAAADTELVSDQSDGSFGNSVASAGDVNGDGYGDVIVGAYAYDSGEPDEGAAFLFLGSASGIADAGPATAAARLQPNQAYAHLGLSVASAGDVNGDGYGDVIVGAPQYDASLDDEGAAFVFLGSPSGIANGSPTTAHAQLESDQADALLGHSVASAGDVNGDGYGDVVVGARDYDNGLTDEGAAFVFHGSASGIANGNPASAAARIESNEQDAFLGISVASAGDVNGDGFGDVIVGAYRYGASEEGAAFVFHGSASGVGDRDPGTADTQIDSNQSGALLGTSATSAGDVNGDGYGDVIVGALYYDAVPEDEGAAFVFLGSAAGVPDGSPATADAQLEGNQGDTDFGLSVAPAGDVNGDGFADVIVGARLYDSGQINEGAAFVFHGNGNRTGRLVLASQRRNETLTTRVLPWGSSYHEGFEASLRRGNPQGLGRSKLEVQWCPPGVPFGHPSCGSAQSASWIDTETYKLTTPALVEGTLYRWRARLLFAPFRVTEAGITPPPSPAHAPWRRLHGQAAEADLRVGLDTDVDGLRNSVDLDDDGDGLTDLDETGLHGTDPLDADSDDDGLQDGPEIALGTNPNDPDHDDDGDLDGADNCPFIVNPDQINGDLYAAGDDCQCGDATGDGTLSSIDYTRAREHVVGRTPGGAFVLERCDVSGDAECGVEDLAILDRLTTGAPATILYSCDAFFALP